jgi:hypothetical protein
MKPAAAEPNARLIVEYLTRAWHHALAFSPAERGDTIEQIERALESAVRLREKLKSS